MSGAVIMVYVMPMLLGQTYDVGKSTPGIQIFNSSTEENSEVIQNYFTDSQYRMVENSNDIKSFLDVNGHLSLKIKAGLVDASGEGSYLKERASRSDAIEILVKVNFQTITRTIKSSWAPKSDWSLEDKKYLGTHYCRSITYGGELIASLRFLASNQSDKEKIKGAIQAEVNAKSLEAGIKANLEMLKEQLHDTSSMEIRYYATVPIPGVAHDVKSLMKLVDDFPSHVKNVNGGLGNPLRMELFPLDSLKTAFPSYMENRALNDQLEDMEDQLDDLLTTRRELNLWLSDLPPVVPSTIDEKITKFAEKLERLLGIYSQAIADLDFGKGDLLKFFEDVFKDYQDGGRLVPHKYSKQFRKLQKEAYEEAPELEPLNGGATYVHWGKTACGQNDETVVQGIAMASNPLDPLTASSFYCSPVQPTVLDPESVSSSKKDLKNLPKVFFSPLMYKGNLSKLAKAKDQVLPCAVCRSTKDTSAFVFHAMTSCPKDWALVYLGLTMAPEKASRKGKYICIDESIEQSSTVNFGSSSEKSPSVVEVGIQCGILPCGKYKEKKPLSCVVCKR